MTRGRDTKKNGRSRSEYLPSLRGSLASLMGYVSSLLVPRRRLNLKVLICLLTVVGIGGTGVHFLHAYQVKRNVAALLRLADLAAEEKDLVKECTHLCHYLTIVPTDDDVFVRYAVAQDKLPLPGPSKGPIALYRARLASFEKLENALQRKPDRHDIRRRVVELALELGRVEPSVLKDAGAYLEILLQVFPNDADLEHLFAECEVRKGQFAAAKKWYEKAIKHAPGQIKSYEQLARLLRRQLNDPHQEQLLRQQNQKHPADLVMEELVRMDERSCPAWEARTRYHLEFGELDKAAKAVAQARELAPDKKEVLLLAAEVAEGQGRELLASGDKDKAQAHFDHARRDLESVLKIHGATLLPHQSLARLDILAGRQDDAIGHLRRAVELAADQPDVLPDALWIMASVLIDLGRLDEAREPIARLRKVKAGPGLVEYLEARILLHEERWAEAAAAFKQVRTLLADLPDLAKQTDLFLARCYEQLGNPDLQREAYAQALKVDPLWLPARLGRAETLRVLGQEDAALDEFRQLAATVPTARLATARLLVLRNLRLPAKDRQWGELDGLLREEGWPNPEPAEVIVLRAQVRVLQDRAAEARRALEAACEKRPDQPTFWVALAYVLRGQGEPDNARDLLDRAARKLGNPVEIRLARAAMLTDRPRAEAREILSALERDAGTLSKADQARLLSGLAGIYQRLGEPKEVERLLGEMARRQPEDLRVRIELLDRALQRDDLAAAGQVLAEIKSLEGPDGPVGSWGEAYRLMKEGDRNQLGKARKLLERAAQQRPSWPPVPYLQGQLDEAQGDLDSALVNYLRAVNLGETNSFVVRRAVRLLYARQRFDEAERLIQKLQEQAPLSNDLSRLAAEVSLRQDKPRALELARQAVPADSRDIRDLVWLGQIEWAAGNKDKAEAALRRAVELGGDVSDTHMALMMYLVRTDQTDRARAAAQAALKQLPAHHGNLVLGVFYGATGQRDQIEAPIQAALTARPHDVAVVQAVATLYLQSGQFDKAEPHLRQILQPAAKATDGQKAWARRTLALRLLARSRAHFAEVLALIEENLKTGGTAEDQSIKAILLATQPARRPEALDLLKDLNKRGALSTDGNFALARLYEIGRDWPAARDLLRSVLNATSNPSHVAQSIESLLRHNEPQEALSWIGKLEELEPQTIRTIDLKARVLQKNGQAAKALDLVKTYAAGQKGDKLEAAAVALERLDPAAAEEVYNRYVAESGGPQSALLLAGYLGRQGRVKEALDCLEPVWDKLPPERAVAGGVAIFSRAKSGGREQFERIEKLIDRTMKRHPDKAAVIQAELAVLRYLQERYPEAEALYRQVLGRDSRDTLAMNNLAWLLAMKKGETAEALKLIESAIDIVGPTADLLDTRGIIHLTAGRTREAAQDLEIAVRESPTASRHMFLAKAYLANGNRGAALQEWKRATEAGLTPGNMDSLERPVYQELDAELSRP